MTRCSKCGQRVQLKDITVADNSAVTITTSCACGVQHNLASATDVPVDAVTPTLLPLSYDELATMPLTQLAGRLHGTLAAAAA